MATRHGASGCPTAAGLERYLGGIDYPASKEELLEHAEQEGAPEDVRQTLEALEPADFDSPAAVSQAVGDLSR